ncbi:hypothetical protein VNO80_13750 [Phaseolus coccineus]|uniref:25S rRNA (uridine-N(3))-methyltransferase BMT5-like domain-containing protein n=1 Tax=Phaseolus coccineus TaxID=3886 RepID=A0AAN9R7B1_PHACN
MEEKRISHYSSFQKILLVGEGDFSFSLCLARAFGTATNMVATSLDSRGSLMVNYARALENLNALEVLGCTVVNEVDAHKMAEHPLLKHQKFDRIIYNFPHAGFLGREDNVFQIELHKNLVRGFLQNAKRILTIFGEIHITHKTKHPYSLWDIKMLASGENLKFVGEEEFDKDLYPGYDNKRGDGSRCDHSFIVGECSTFMFSRSFLY